MICSCWWQVFFAIVLGAIGLTQAQMAFPDVAKAGGASKRVFTVIDRQPLIQDAPDGRFKLCLDSLGIHLLSLQRGMGWEEGCCLCPMPLALRNSMLPGVHVELQQRKGSSLGLYTQ